MSKGNGLVSFVFFQEISQRQSDSPDDRSDLQDRLVHVSPPPLCHDAQSLGGTELQGTVEVDETFVGPKAMRKIPVVALIERHGLARVKVIASVLCQRIRLPLEHAPMF